MLPRLIAAASLLLATAAPAQVTLGVVAAGEFGSRTVGSAPDGLDATVDALREGSGFAFAPGLGVIAERKFGGLFSVSTQLRYTNTGYAYELAPEGFLDPFTGRPIAGDPADGSVRYRYEFLSLAIGASEVWGRGRVRCYAEEYLTPMLLLSTRTSAARGAAARLPGPRRERANDFHIGVRGGVGAQTEIGSGLRLRLGVTANYHFTQTFDDIGLREHLFGFGPELALLRVIGGAGTADGPADEIYY